MSRLPASMHAGSVQQSVPQIFGTVPNPNVRRHAFINRGLSVQALAQQYHHPLSSCVAKLQLPQQPVSCSKHRKDTVIGYCAASAASAGVEAAADAEQQQTSSTHLVIDVDASEDTNGDDSSGKQPAVVIIKMLTSAEELQAVARLRAEAYYAEDRSRFADSFKKQFTAQEVESLRSRTSGSNGRPQLSACLLALQPVSNKVLGCIDIRLPQTATGTRALGVPEDDAAGCYLLNVVVSENWRGQGIGKALMAAAMAQAVHVWGAQRLYTHVEADNEVASGLYKSCGFREHSSEEKYANTLSLGRLVLLMASAADVPAVQDTLFVQQQA